MIILSESYDMALAAAIPICHVLGFVTFILEFCN
jgi:hypothetical protein